jgi:outer membrane usher protein FimD/PapC
MSPSTKDVALFWFGFQVQRNYSTRPDLITYPLPQFIGQAALPSTVDLIINGQKKLWQWIGN